MVKKFNEKLNIISLFRKLGENENDEFKLIILVNTLLELLVNILVKEKIKNNKVVEGNEYTYAIKLVILNEKNIINDVLFKEIEILRKIRNRAAHEPIFHLNNDELRGLPIRENEKLYDGCMIVLGSLWNENKDIFLNYFNLE